jgi:hypothetical protein
LACDAGKVYKILRELVHNKDAIKQSSVNVLISIIPKISKVLAKR